MTGAQTIEVVRRRRPGVFLADPTGMIERECAEPTVKQRTVAATYAIAIRDEDVVPVDWKRVNAAITARWPRGLERVKRLAWRHFERGGSS